MDYRKIIAESWSYTQQHKRLIFWFGFIPSIFSTTFGIGYLAYQFFAFKTSPIFNYEGHSFFEEAVAFIWEFSKAHLSWTIPLIAIAVFFFLMNATLPTLAKGSAIQMIARNRSGQNATVGTGLKYGVLNFLKLFEYHLLIKTFAFFSILIEMSFVWRNLGNEIFLWLMPVFILFMGISVLLTLLFTFSDFFIVIDDEGVFSAMKKSGKLVLMNWKHTFLVTLLMIIIGIRIVIQAVMVFLIPFLIFLLTGYVATIAFATGTGLIIAAVVGFISLIVAAYLNGVVDVFAYTVWTYTFLDLTSQAELSARENIEIKDDIKEVSGDQITGHKNLN